MSQVIHCWLMSSCPIMQITQIWIQIIQIKIALCFSLSASVAL